MSCKCNRASQHLPPNVACGCIPHRSRIYGSPRYKLRAGMTFTSRSFHLNPLFHLMYGLHLIYPICRHQAGISSLGHFASAILSISSTPSGHILISVGHLVHLICLPLPSKNGDRVGVHILFRPCQPSNMGAIICGKIEDCLI